MGKEKQHDKQYGRTIKKCTLILRKHSRNEVTYIYRHTHICSTRDDIEGIITDCDLFVDAFNNCLVSLCLSLCLCLDTSYVPLCMDCTPLLPLSNRVLPCLIKKKKIKKKNSEISIEGMKLHAL